MSQTSRGDAPQADYGALAERPLALLYLSGSAADVDLTTTRLLGGLTNFQALFLSPTLGEKEVLQVVTTFREARTPVAIVPVVTEAHHGLCTSAVAAGADGVMPLLDGVFVAPNATLKCIWDSPHRPAEEAKSDQAALAGFGRRNFGNKLHAFFCGIEDRRAHAIARREWVRTNTRRGPHETPTAAE